MRANALAIFCRLRWFGSLFDIADDFVVAVHPILAEGWSARYPSRKEWFVCAESLAVLSTTPYSITLPQLEIPDFLSLLLVLGCCTRNSVACSSTLILRFVWRFDCDDFTPMERTKWSDTHHDRQLWSSNTMYVWYTICSWCDVGGTIHLRYLSTFMNESTDCEWVLIRIESSRQ